MPAQSRKVVPPALLAASASVAAAAQQAAAVHPGTLAHAVPGSPADSAWATIAAGMVAQTVQMSGEVSGKGPEVEAKTPAGVAQLQTQDADNAAQIQTVGESAVGAAAYPGGDIPV